MRTGDGKEQKALKGRKVLTLDPCLDMDAGEVRHWNADVKNVSFHVAEQGPEDGPAVLLLHKFLELWFSWRHQIAKLAVRGCGPGAGEHVGNTGDGGEVERRSADLYLTQNIKKALAL